MYGQGGFCVPVGKRNQDISNYGYHINSRILQSKAAMFIKNVKNYTLEAYFIS